MARARSPQVRVRRAYDPPDAEDGARALVDRLWPRGLRKADATLERLRALAEEGPVTLLTATAAVELSQAAVLAEVVAGRRRPG